MNALVASHTRVNSPGTCRPGLVLCTDRTGAPRGIPTGQPALAIPADWPTSNTDLYPVRSSARQTKPSMPMGVGIEAAHPADQGQLNPLFLLLVRALAGRFVAENRARLSVSWRVHLVGCTTGPQQTPGRHGDSIDKEAMRAFLPCLGCPIPRPAGTKARPAAAALGCPSSNTCKQRNIDTRTSG